MSSETAGAPAAPAADEATPAAAATAPPAFEIPEKMKKMVVIESGAEIKDCKFEIQQVPVPKPAPTELLVKVVAAAVNPSDYGSWVRAKPEDCPKAMGLEGCGIVVATGGSLITKRVKIGAKVGIVGLKNNQGTYSEYVTIAATDSLFVLPDDLPTEDAASFFVNPYTTISILETAKSMGSKALVHTAAASQLGQMMVKLAAQGGGGMEVINVVRREEQAKLLQDLGAKHIVSTSESNWKETLKSKIDELKCTVAFDAVAGDMSGELLSLLPPKGTVMIYGALAGKVGGFDPVDLIYQEKQVKGFLVMQWIQHGGMILSVPRMLAAGRKVNAGLAKGGWCSSQFQDTSLENVQEDLVKAMKSGITGAKLRVRLDK